MHVLTLEIFQQLILDLQRRCAEAEARIANLCLYTQSLQVIVPD
jgi:hypothetical protein